MSEFHPVIKLPRLPDGAIDLAQVEVADFTKGYDPQRFHRPYVIGRYNEKRVGMYVSAIFKTNDTTNGSSAITTVRDVHVGVDIGAPHGTEVFAYDDGEIFLFAIRSEPGDYGGTLITKHDFKTASGSRVIYALHGHLSHRSVLGWQVGQRFRKGDRLGWVGAENENGGWNPHVHFQLSWIAPVICDLPGVVSEADREQALKDYPDPRLVLGPLYSDTALV